MKVFPIDESLAESLQAKSAFTKEITEGIGQQREELSQGLRR